MLTRFALDVVRDEAARMEKFVRGLRLDLQGIVRALRPATHANALRIALDLSLHERADSSKATGRGSALGQKRKVETQLDVIPQRTLRSGGVFQRHRRELATAGRTLREYPLVLPVGESMEVVAWLGVEFASGADSRGTLLMRVLENPLRRHRTSLLLSSRGEFLTLPDRRPSELRFPLGSVLSVSTPSGEVLLSKEKIKACRVVIANHELDVTLLVLDMQDFDVILGMDWLGAGIVCIPKVISAMKARKLLNQGTWGIFASVVDTREPGVSLSSKPVVREYPDVFPDELLGLPPPREIDFAIELEPGTAPISRAPYRMAPAELKELKVQLQELLDKGFIRPSVSPWGP
ncbi:gag protease polyprotein [Cucumis melo var. makuwa]|uniref:Gag protease polyprotein n=1 Tax=Cucumis melo var. makuwa TaxID=1194695 RepID=A0A5D3CEX7_CUCMM|nr:gag protease polyprotein [Cucumis melo var. makuwa]